MQNSQTNSGETPPAPAPAPQTVTLTLDELDAYITEKIAQKERFNALMKDINDVEEEPEAAPTVASTWPYGNQDRKKQFDLSKMTTLRELPTDKVIIAMPAYNRDSEGAVIGIDMKNTRIQYLDPAHYQSASKPDKETATTTFQLLAVQPIVLHKPE